MKRFHLASLALALASSIGANPASGSKGVVLLENLSSEDVSIQSLQSTWIYNTNNWKHSFALSKIRSSIDYTPSSLDLVGNPSARSESSTSISLNTSYEHTDDFQSQYSLNYYSGFSDYRSIWLDEFYRQQFEPVPGYELADPHGYSASIGTRIEYIPTTARLELNAGYQFDNIAPAYEATPFEPLQQGIPEIETYFTSLSSENLLTEKLKTKFQLRLSNSTARDLRAFIGLRTHYALDNYWVLKCDLGTTRESTEFDSKHLGLAIERDLTSKLLLGLLARRYSDSGEISDPTILSTAAPELSSTLYALNLTWNSDRMSLHLMAGKYESDYDDLPDISFQFENLYRDREWNLVRFSGSYSF